MFAFSLSLCLSACFCGFWFLALDYFAVMWCGCVILAVLFIGGKHIEFTKTGENAVQSNCRRWRTNWMNFCVWLLLLLLLLAVDVWLLTVVYLSCVSCRRVIVAYNMDLWERYYPMKGRNRTDDETAQRYQYYFSYNLFTPGDHSFYLIHVARSRQIAHTRTPICWMLPAWLLSLSLTHTLHLTSIGRCMCVRVCVRVFVFTL